MSSGVIRDVRAWEKDIITLFDDVQDNLNENVRQNIMFQRERQNKSSNDGENSSKSKTFYEVRLGHNQNGGSKLVEEFKSKQNALRYFSQNLPYYGFGEITRGKVGKNGKVTAEAKKRDPKDVQARAPRAPTPYQKFTQARWAEIKQDQNGVKFQKGEVQGYMKQIGQYWRQEQANGSAPAPKTKPKGSGLTMKDKLAKAQKNPSEYQKTNKKGLQIWDMTKVMRIK